MYSGLKNLLLYIVTVSIRLYRLCISPLIGPRCRFLPTCSDYAEEAFKIHGPLYGSFLVLRRLFRCNIFARQRVDPVPSKKDDEV